MPFGFCTVSPFGFCFLFFVVTFYVFPNGKMPVVVLIQPSYMVGVALVAIEFSAWLCHFAFCLFDYVRQADYYCNNNNVNKCVIVG